MNVRKRVVVKGRVQGVWFRVSAKNMATSLGLKGFVQNLDDGSVLLDMEGTEEAAEEMIVWCRTGPPGANVTGVDVSDKSFVGFTKFEIRY